MARPKPAPVETPPAGGSSQQQRQRADRSRGKEKRFFTEKPADIEPPVSDGEKRKTKRARVGKRQDSLATASSGVHPGQESARRRTAGATASTNASAIVPDEVRELERFLFGARSRAENAGETQTAKATATQKRRKSGGREREAKDAASSQGVDGDAADSLQPRKKKRHGEKDETNGEGATAAPAAKNGAASSEDREEEASSSEGRASEETGDAREANRDSRRVWVDPDDACVSVNICANRKLRKLRVSEQEETLGGDALQKRLATLHRRLVQSQASTSWVEKARQRKREAEVARDAQKREAGDSDVSDDASSPHVTQTGQSVAGIQSGSSVFSSKGLLRRLARERKTGALVEATRERIPQKKIVIRRLANANEAEPSASVISALEFHPRTSLLMTAGRDQALRLFSVDGKENRKVESVFLQDFPVLAARFTRHNGGGQILAISNANRSLAEYDLETGSVNKIPGIAGRRQERCFHFLEMGGGRRAEDASSFLVTQKTFALASANSQDVLLCDVQSKRLLNVFSMNANVAALAFHPTKEAIFTADREAFIYEWDLRSGNCVSKFQDASCLRLSAMAASPAACLSSTYEASSFLATGSRTGYVDFFSLSDSASTKPVKELGNLTTEISTLAFHPSNQLLCAASRWKKDALRLIHLPSLTVYQNWPTERTPLRYVTAADFSCDNGFLAVGNDRGNALLYQIRHFA
ncbi:WD-40 repeat protein [Toxoplasma gondii ME49]|uniref:WD-40 repeat protein n=4 Tax=Toxoplasma gondii TaxID=5811 RepID=A0A086KNN1_TOXGO|nr:WD-40 repeat protein [Toxoplasma gondii ME49]EPT26772.1 WD-40 repeat protein [Toxoplasma gondii ME49]KFG45999.1 WD-40 repeat protein [Toxoplasma gondii GAB2-2007-GAL-DOM2]KYF42364.1 WD-40 repeat protein [Toxoplasma gondii ARI]|eukprot:XP_002368901.1 WD-40 repeat protein [Toxoplasma gondii ME49]